MVCIYGRTGAGGASTPGTFALIPVDELGDDIYVAIFVAEFVPVSNACTGKFAGVSGSWIMYAFAEPFQLGSSDPLEYSWSGDGSLNFKKGK